MSTLKTHIRLYERIGTLYYKLIHYLICKTVMARNGSLMFQIQKCILFPDTLGKNTIFIFLCCVFFSFQVSNILLLWQLHVTFESPISKQVFASNYMKLRVFSQLIPRCSLEHNL